MKAPCLNVCVSNKDDQRYLVICNLKNILFTQISEVPLQSFVESLCLFRRYIPDGHYGQLTTSVNMTFARLGHRACLTLILLLLNFEHCSQKLNTEKESRVLCKSLWL